MARAHAKAGDPSRTLGYIGTGDRFELVIGEFAASYAEQVQHDFEALQMATKKGWFAVG